MRYWILPNIESYRDDLERALTRATGQRIAIGELSADWHVLRPHFSLGNVVVYDTAGRPALELARIDNSLSWLSLVVLEPRFHTMEIHRPHLEVRRARDGTVSVAGIALRGGEGGRSLADWILRQPQVTITGASIEWVDEQRGAPGLELGDVTLRLQNEYFRHLFALTARGHVLLQGDVESAGNWVDTLSGPPPDQPMLWFEEPQVTRVRVLLARGSCSWMKSVCPATSASRRRARRSAVPRRSARRSALISR